MEKNNENTKNNHKEGFRICEYTKRTIKKMGF